eukprot:6267835-Alexandrium_andersonii.AAC.1
MTSAYSSARHNPAVEMISPNGLTVRMSRLVVLNPCPRMLVVMPRHPANISLHCTRVRGPHLRQDQREDLKH